MAKSPCRRADLAEGVAGSGARLGNETASISSSSCRSVIIMPAKNDSAGRRRARLRERSRTSPPSATRQSGISALGSACATEPQTVPRARVWK